jgi:N-methylhydantoinase B
LSLDLLTGVPAGTIYHQLAGGGGGYGDPLDRPAERVVKEVRNGVISVQTARDAYGVAIDQKTLKVDQQATQARRKKNAKRQAE